MNKERQPAPWLPPGTIHTVGRLAARERARPASSGSRRMPWAERRSQLLDACLESFVARGLEMTTMDTIASQAGVSKPLVYRHFHNRSEALLAVVAQESDRILGQLGLVGESTARPDFEGLLTGFLAFAADRPKSYRLLFQLVDASSGPPRRQLDSLRATISQGLERSVLAQAGVGEDLSDAVSISRLGHLMLSILEGVAGGLLSGDDAVVVAATLSRLLRPDWVLSALLPAADPAEQRRPTTLASG